MSHAHTITAENLPRVWAFTSLLVFLCFPATALIQEYLGLGGVALYVGGVFAALVVLLRFESSIYRLVEKHYTVVAGLAAAGLVAVFAVVYPLETSGRLSTGSDRDEALNIAVASLVRGQYPYYERTPLGGEITPLPGAMLLAAPFVALGNSAYQNLFWLPVFLYATSLYLKNRVSALILLVAALALSPSVQYEFISGGDLLANSLYIVVFIFLAVSVFSRPDAPAWLRLAASIALGVGLASRPNFFILLPLLFALLVKRASLKLAAACIAVACLAAGLVILPFYFFDPASFSPLAAGNKLAEFDALSPYVSSGIVAATIGLAILLAVILIKHPGPGATPLFFWMGALTQFFPIFCGVVLASISRGYPDFSFTHDRYGLMFLFLGLWGCWPYLYRQPNESL